jgi:hypothetical protein
MAALPYKCENDDCRLVGETQRVPRGQEATCQACGWFMQSIDDGTVQFV